jgi:hypothetical protein
MTFKEFTKELNGSRIEGELVKTGFYSLLTSFIVIGLFYAVNIVNTKVIGKYGLVLLLSALSYALIMLAVRQVGNYGKNMPCMSGMMVGMTIGMISGFLPGFYIGMTNGMFVGSAFGMLVGMIFGVWNGKCCGIMGAMEGIMAGFMGGLMGAMTSVMMLNDNVSIMAWIVLIVSAVIMIGLNYMVYNEMKEIKGKNGDNWNIIWISGILMALTVLIVVYGPRSFLVI